MNRKFVLGIVAGAVVGTVGVFVMLFPLTGAMMGLHALAPWLPVDGRASIPLAWAVYAVWAMLWFLIGFIPGFPPFVRGFLIPLLLPATVLVAAWVGHEHP